jgi:D-hydroxyproline dehydrogenase subunit gamma
VSGRLAIGPELRRGARVTVTIDADPVVAHAGETVAAVLIAEGSPATRVTKGGAPRGVFCGMGVCFDCLVVVDGIPNTRACMTWVREGMTIGRQDVYVAAGSAR